MAHYIKSSSSHVEKNPNSVDSSNDARVLLASKEHCDLGTANPCVLQSRELLHCEQRDLKTEPVDVHDGLLETVDDLDGRVREHTGELLQCRHCDLDGLLCTYVHLNFYQHILVLF